MRSRRPRLRRRSRQSKSISTARSSTRETLPLPCVSAAFVAKTVPFLAVLRYKEELKEKKKDQALQNYGKISDLNQCTFQPLLTETSLKYAQENPRGAIWDRLEQDQNEAKRNLEEASAQEQARVSGSAMRDHLHEARLYIMAAVRATKEMRCR